MADFNKTQWSNDDYVREYLNKVDAIIPQRQHLLELMGSFFRHFMADEKAPAFLELGCGDGAFTEALLTSNKQSRATLIDGSKEMLGHAKKRLANHSNINYICATFQEITTDNAPSIKHADFDLVFSVLAIHHLSKDEKTALFKYIHTILKPGGFFINIDDCVPPSAELELWYLELWNSDMKKKATELEIDLDPEAFNEKHKEAAHHAKLDTMHGQLTALEETGFVGVDCFFKDGIFTMYGGQKSGRTL
jgi:tRNA (cmo5U34)-methyltransferase